MKYSRFAKFSVDMLLAELVTIAINERLFK
jgi:hypothetical protein